LLEGLTREVGIPLRSGSSFMQVTLLTVPAEKLALSGGADVDMKGYTLAIRAADGESSSSIKGIFTRIGVACAPTELVNTLVDRKGSMILRLAAGS
jgi:hypothetical protein